MTIDCEDKRIIFKESADCISQYADHFGYSSFGDTKNRIGSISFFKHVIEWIDDENTRLTRETIANIKMPEEQFLRLAEYIIEQREKSKNEQ
ncbi:MULTISPECIES: hypothetical protein [unclassified Arsenophonus]|uniref:hypothetical protein n=1 Tax=unclassified Arsenophonus TaxID=2627083 RepID=UPI0028660063|nr:hypothetical protein [Arsenophonus sp.]MDR5611357.1 hypothetical protein [Arsenophonus sp.]MDR5612196.1 hypothetical protein [Arsenophonus sp.]MDR5615391.1 hypothetical protein [Arsenophonus sp.]